MIRVAKIMLSDNMLSDNIVLFDNKMLSDNMLSDNILLSALIIRLSDNTML
jgi:hypothetical protein